MANQSQFAKSYNSFSGVDIKAVFAGEVVAELQAISYSITREKAPLYTMGAADPRSFSRGKRGIAGTLIFLMFDKHVMISHLGMLNDNVSSILPFLADKDDPRPAFNAGTQISTTQDTTNSSGATVSGVAGLDAFINAGGGESSLTGVADDQEISAPWYTDQIPPFDITLAAANEYGALAVMSVIGVEILNEGYGVSIDDIVSEMQNTYVARGVSPWRAVSNSAVAGRPESATKDLKASALPVGST